ncbi:DUF1801 domain-containing protein [Candidatus Saccharibacteria bacterium]|nr:DUF1801 domain-containing protein [Candidatus Saccharibacteria bacterium]
MSDIKTKSSDASVDDFINSVENETRKLDGFTLLEIYSRLTGEKPKLWSNTTSGFIGFGQYHYKSEKSSQEGDWPLAAFSPRKQNLAVYIMSGLSNYTGLLNKLGKHKVSTGMGSCLYINKLADVDQKVLEKLIATSYADMKKNHS